MNKTVLKSTFIAFFAALICIGCFMVIPIGVVPIVLQNILCILIAVLLGGILGAAPTALFLIAGLIGLPVYAGGRGGISVLMGPTGGFLFGYLIGAIVAGLIAGTPSIIEKRSSKLTIIRVAVAIFAGMIILYIPGVIRFASWAIAGGKVPENTSTLAYTMGTCVLPYLPGDFLKSIAAIPIALKIRPILAQYLYTSSNN